MTLITTAASIRQEDTAHHYPLSGDFAGSCVIRPLVEPGDPDYQTLLSSGKLPLNTASLSLLNDPTLGYDRDMVEPGVVHLGPGGFFKSHFATIIDDVLSQGHLDWGITAVSLRSNSEVSRSKNQDGLYTVVHQGSPQNGGDRVRVVGSVIDYKFAPDDPGAVIKLMASPQTKLVSLTVTGGGYYLNPDVSGSTLLNLSHPDIEHDLNSGGRDRPVTMYGYLAAALAQRKEAGREPFSILPLDNLQDNGGKLQQALGEFLEIYDPALALWVQQKVIIPSTMVDRITPSFRRPNDSNTGYDRQGLTYLLGQSHEVADRLTVLSEEHRELVIQDVGIDLPPFEGIDDVKVVKDVRPFFERKLFMLNGAHAFVGWLGALEGSTQFVHEFVNLPGVDGLLTGYCKEVGMSLPAEVAADQDRYIAKIIKRLLNENLRDPHTRVGRDPSRKVVYAIDPAQRMLREGMDLRALHFLPLFAAGHDVVVNDYNGGVDLGLPNSKEFPVPEVESQVFEQKRSMATAVLRSGGVRETISLYNRLGGMAV